MTGPTLFLNNRQNLRHRIFCILHFIPPDNRKTENAVSGVMCQRCGIKSAVNLPGDLSYHLGFSDARSPHQVKGILTFLRNEIVSI